MPDFPRTSDLEDSAPAPRPADGAGVPETTTRADSPSGPHPPDRHGERAPELIRRLKSIEGHVRGIQKMVSEDAYCIDLLRQIKAVRAALDRVGQIALETHLETCVTDGLRSDDPAEREKIIAEILEIFDARAKR